MRKCLLGDIADIQTGPFGSQLHSRDYAANHGTPIVTVEHLGERKFACQNLPLVKDEDKLRLLKYTMLPGDIIFSRVGSVDRCSYALEENSGWLFSGRCLRIRCNGEVDPTFLYFYLSSVKVKSFIRRIAVGATMPSINTSIMGEIPIELPSLDVQKAIGEFITLLDEKIELNNQINDYLLELATVRFEQALISESDTFRFSELVELEDSKREPLNSRDRETRKGIYPYYGATSIMDYIDDYLFDGIRVLVGEDGTVIQEDGKPVLQYVWGKYWVNNHAHVLRSKSDYSLEAIYIALARTAISHIVTGAVQMKISQKNLNNLELEMPQPSSLRYLEDIFTLYRKSTEESKMLERLRDLLLPRLMSGEIDVSKIDITQLNNHLSDC